MTAERRLELDDQKASKPSALHTESTIKQLLSDIEPFFYGRPLVYVDVGAHKGDVFREVYTSSLTLQKAYLIEPNPTSFAALECTVRALGAEAIAVCHNTALAAAPQQLHLRDAGTMTKVIEPADGSSSFKTEATTLDAIIQVLPRSRVSILKVDVEGYECQVFAGAAEILGAQAIDLIYVEAGMDPASTQQTYYRDIEDLLRTYGYRLFRVYEQTHEWMEDSPLLRRVNLAFLSQAFAARNPYRLSRRLFAARGECRELKQTLAEAEAQCDTAREKLASLSAAHEAQVAKADQLAANHVEALAKRDAALASAHQQLENQSNENNNLKVALAERFEEIAQMTRMLEARKNEAKELAQMARMLDAATREARSFREKVDTLTSSTSWRLMAPARGIVSMIRRRS